MTDSQAIFYHGRVSFAWAIGAIVVGTLGITESRVYFIGALGMALVAGWHLGKVIVRSR